jgi:hypothetical protein
MISYKLHQDMPGLYFEVYLPIESLFDNSSSMTRESDFKKKLNEILVGGFNYKDILKPHFTVNSSSIQSFLSDNCSDLKNFDSDQAKLTEEIFGGFSIYMVEGGWWSTEKKEIVQEPTCTLRLFFRPDYEGMSKKFNSKITEILPIAAKFIENEFMEENVYDPQIIDYLRNWENAVRLFLFGYLLYKVADINLLNENRESEILVISIGKMNMIQTKLVRLTPAIEMVEIVEISGVPVVENAKVLPKREDVISVSGNEIKVTLYIITMGKFCLFFELDILDKKRYFEIRNREEGRNALSELYRTGSRSLPEVLENLIKKDVKRIMLFSE